ncbi:MAG TPA: choice-of-anchor V domain-containing protein [Candidatus Eisenbacteria bacterium]|jgi:hypothetical protein|nr:choice-of-anchor V domain-containing protein [Candidatus Eisenbacteria bacterium]
MRSNSTRRITAGLVLAALAVAAGAGRLAAHSNGVSGKYALATGCSCHGAAANGNGNVVVDIAGPTTVGPGLTAHYTLTVSGDPAGSTGGVDLKASAGTLVPGTGTKLSSTELVHSDNLRRSWSFDWQAPVAEGSYNFQAVALCDNNDGSTDGDSWNWFGAVAGTAFAVTVSQAVDVDPRSPLTLQMESPYPNPSANQARVTFTLPRDARVDLELMDVRGRSAAVLISGVLQAGPHTILWDARDLSGGSTPSGVYWLRLSTGTTTLTRRWTLVR